MTKEELITPSLVIEFGHRKVIIGRPKEKENGDIVHGVMFMPVENAIEVGADIPRGAIDQGILLLFPTKEQADDVFKAMTGKEAK